MSTFTVPGTYTTIPVPEPEVGYDDKKSAKENLARAMFEIAKQLRLARQQFQTPQPPLYPQLPLYQPQPPLYPQLPPMYPWWQIPDTYPGWRPDITCGTGNDR